MTRPSISSAQNAQIKLVRALLGRTRERRETGAFLAEGVRLVEEALESRWPFRFVLHSTDLGERGQQLVRRLKLAGIQTDEVATRLLASLSETDSPQGVLAVLEAVAPRAAGPLKYVLITDAVRDPGNLGTLLRSAEAAGMDAVMLAPGTADAFSPKVVRAGMGAHFRLPMYEVSWPEIKTQAAAENWKIYLADMQGRPCWEADLRGPLALIVGGEAQGASAEARQLASEAVTIPMRGKAESLNAGVAGAVLMFEVARRRTSGEGTPP